MADVDRAAVEQAGVVVLLVRVLASVGFVYLSNRGVGNAYAIDVMLPPLGQQFTWTIGVVLWYEAIPALPETGNGITRRSLSSFGFFQEILASPVTWCIL